MDQKCFGGITIPQHKTDISLLMVMLAIPMFNAGMGVKIFHLKNILRKKHALLIGLEIQYILMGLALVAAMPIAGPSIAWAQNANGNLALSLGSVFFPQFGVLSPRRQRLMYLVKWRRRTLQDLAVTVR